ncbi:hypothetical protein BO83DRAFT_126163 [Aspergillus eucalypticola CBS 122712]|uniref:Uncharacterized protein n=1 Tax=Aspergillus eucalypticola (strain CBS 122712 / IBT 29274) TaxID=1448314 RepID=A0A317UU55_ASPEC|nr:uncharacterized protein BO83DRAFT_126163 [Aspergillus eucalypticola CBS 122712]PWY64876.1 hypothetical protein BO83DRAFT_126163 [Aspergillus eucalypticola CBS 122712]
MANERFVRRLVDFSRHCLFSLGLTVIKTENNNSKFTTRVEEKVNNNQGVIEDEEETNQRSSCCRISLLCPPYRTGSWSSPSSALLEFDLHSMNHAASSSRHDSAHQDADHILL